MNSLLEMPVARSEKNEERIDLRAPTLWVHRVEFAARKKGLGVSAYIRMVVAERMEADRIPEELPEAKPAKRK